MCPLCRNLDFLHFWTLTKNPKLGVMWGDFHPQDDFVHSCKFFFQLIGTGFGYLRLGLIENAVLDTKQHIWSWQQLEMSRDASNLGCSLDKNTPSHIKPSSVYPKPIPLCPKNTLTPLEKNVLSLKINVHDIPCNKLLHRVKNGLFRTQINEKKRF